MFEVERLAILFCII